MGEFNTICFHDNSRHFWPVIRRATDVCRRRPNGGSTVPSLPCCLETEEGVCLETEDGVVIDVNCDGVPPDFVATNFWEEEDGDLILSEAGFVLELF